MQVSKGLGLGLGQGGVWLVGGLWQWGETQSALAHPEVDRPPSPSLLAKGCGNPTYGHPHRVHMDMGASIGVDGQPPQPSPSKLPGCNPRQPCQPTGEPVLTTLPTLHPASLTQRVPSPTSPS